MPPKGGVCAVCLSPAEQKCSGCQAVHYCTRDHQKQHWKMHKGQCNPFKVKEDPKFGRYLEATRDIKAGDIVMREKPLITGPAQVTPPVCLGCYKLLEEGKVVPCAKCGWPFCSEECTQREEHDPECFYTHNRGEKVNISTFGMPHPNYQCITVLRCLYQRDHNPELWVQLTALQSHCEERRGTDKWNNDLKMVAEFIWKFFKLEKTFTEEEIMKCCGILQINGHEVPLLEPEYVAVFDRISMAEHNCRANCNKSFTSNGEIILVAGINISCGSHVSVCYTDPMWGTEARRHHLADSKFFECSCERCSDPTEFGTMYSAVKCKKKDCKGYLLPDSFLVPILHKTTNPDPATRNLDNKFWKCSCCQDAVSDAIIQQLLQDIGRELSAMPKEDPDACERFIGHCSSYLHPTHYYMTDVSLALAQMVGQESEVGVAGVSEDRLLLKTQLCRKIADLIETLAPDYGNKEPPVIISPQINGHEVPLLEPEYVAVFDRISMAEHNCRANCNKSFTSNGEIILVAGINISCGSHVSVCYTDPMWGTEARRHHLADSKFFECSCERCSDPTEFGTMYSAVKCKKKDCKGYLLPDSFLVPILHKTTNPDPATRNLDNKFWKCSCCQDAVSDAIIQQLLQDIGRELSAMPKEDPDACERFIGHCSSYLHPTHYYMTDVSLALAQMVGQESEVGVAGVSEDRLLLKTQLCRKIADLIETLAPAETRLRGSLLFELHAAVAETGRRQSLTDGPLVLLGYVTESRKILVESASLLRHEPPELPEGRLAQQAKMNLLQMEDLIRNLSSSLPSPM